MLVVLDTNVVVSGTMWRGTLIAAGWLALPYPPSGVRGYCSDGNFAFPRAIKPKKAVRAWRLVLDITFPDLFAVGPLHPVEFVGLQGPIAEVGSHQIQRLVHRLQHRLF